MEKDSKTTVAVERTTFAKLDRLAKANSVSKMEYITHAINYFEKYGINPVEHESPAQEMQKLIKRMDQVFAFLKKQETDLVRPACEALAGASTQITISLSSLLSEEKFRRFLKDNKEQLAEIINSSGNNGKAIGRAEKAVRDADSTIRKNQDIIFKRIEASETAQLKAMQHILCLKIRHPEQFRQAGEPTFKSDLHIIPKSKGLGIIALAEIVIALFLTKQVFQRNGKPAHLIQIADAFEKVFNCSFGSIYDQQEKVFDRKPFNRTKAIDFLRNLIIRKEKEDGNKQDEK